MKNMLLRIIFAMILNLLSMPFTGAASVKPECWVVSNTKGYSASSENNYVFEKDGISKPIVVCFEKEGGTVSGTDTKFVKFGSSTLGGMVQKGELELFEVYQLDRKNNKMLISKSRVGTQTVYSFMFDVIFSFVGDATQVQK